MQYSGISQGCPLSLKWTALLLRPWLLAMRDMGAQGRVLADDMLVITVGDGHGQVFEQAFDETHRMMKGPSLCGKRMPSSNALNWRSMSLLTWDTPPSIVWMIVCLMSVYTGHIPLL